MVCLNAWKQAAPALSIPSRDILSRASIWERVCTCVSGKNKIRERMISTRKGGKKDMDPHLEPTYPPP